MVANENRCRIERAGGMRHTIRDASTGRPKISYFRINCLQRLRYFSCHVRA
jgi:hypothetical protein